MLRRYLSLAVDFVKAMATPVCSSQRCRSFAVTTVNRGSYSADVCERCARAEAAWRPKDAS